MSADKEMAAHTCPVCGDWKFPGDKYCHECTAYAARIQTKKEFEVRLRREDARRKFFGALT